MTEGKAKKLLKSYRPTLWRKKALEASVGVQNQSVKDCERSLAFIRDLVEQLLDQKRVGDKLYWVIYITYMTEQQPKDVYEALEKVTEAHEEIPRSSYFRLRKQALALLDQALGEMHS